jgi:hypothetical protein
MNTHKILVVLIMGILIASTTGGFLGAGENTLNNTDGMISKTEEHKISLSKPIFTDAGEFINIAIEEQTSYLMDEGKPMLPVFTKVYTFPLGTTINNVNVQINQNIYTLDKKVEPSPEPVLLTFTDEEINSVENNYDENQYNNLDIYPSSTYEIKTGAGLDGEEHVLILNIRCYTQYKPAENKIYVPDEIIINLDYNLPPEPLFNNDEYDLLIITHEKFEADLQPLVNHKNNIGIKTKMTTVDEIYSQYTGVADWEEIKLYIYDAVINWGITYVLLAGGHKGQTYEWYVPEFRSNNYDDSDITDRDAIMDITYSSDLYFSDVMFTNQYGKPMFNNWDGNGNGIYAEGPYYDSYDIIEFYPDVYIGRIPLMYSWETTIVVDKIINYETNSDKSWFKNAVFVGGDTSPPARGNVDPGVYEGELQTSVTANYLSQKDFTINKLYTSTGTFTGGQDIINALENGCGYIDFAGHGNPALWGNFLPDAPTEAEFVYGFTIFDIKDYNNGDKLPFMVIDGCHNAQFDVTMQHVVEYGSMSYPGNYWLDWSPHDGCSWFLLQEGGGAIATVGNTALGYGYINKYVTQGLGGWIMPRLAYEYTKGITALGEMMGQSVTDYVNGFPIQTDMIDRKTIEERVLIGDPSLKLGGNNPSFSGPDEDNDEEIPVSFSGIDVPVWQVGNTWTYVIEDINLNIHETEGRDIDIKLNADDFTLTVTAVQSDTYITEFSTSNAYIEADIYFDQYVEGKTPINTSITLKNVDLTGQIIFTKASLAIKSVELNINLDIIENLEGLPIQFDLPPFIEKLLPKIKLPADIQVQLNFDPAFTFLDFPLETGKSWGMPATALTIRIDGEINSIWLRLANLFNKIFHFIPDDLAKYLPVIDIGDILEDFGIPSLINMDIPAMEKFFRKPLFDTKTIKTITVPAGTYDSHLTLFAQGLGEIYYSPVVGNFVKLSAAINQYCPIIQNIDMELKSTNK